MRVTVNSPDAKSQQLNISPFISVFSFKNIIQESLNIKGHFELKFNNKILKNELSLKKYNIKNNSVVHVTHKLKGGRTSPGSLVMQILQFLLYVVVLLIFFKLIYNGTIMFMGNIVYGAFLTGFQMLYKLLSLLRPVKIVIDILFQNPLSYFFIMVIKMCIKIVVPMLTIFVVVYYMVLWFLNIVNSSDYCKNANFAHIDAKWSVIIFIGTFALTMILNAISHAIKVVVQGPLGRYFGYRTSMWITNFKEMLISLIVQSDASFLRRIERVLERLAKKQVLLTNIVNNPDFVEKLTKHMTEEPYKTQMRESGLDGVIDPIAFDRRQKPGSIRGNKTRAQAGITDWFITNKVWLTLSFIDILNNLSSHGRAEDLQRNVSELQDVLELEKNEEAKNEIKAQIDNLKVMLKQAKDNETFNPKEIVALLVNDILGSIFVPLVMVVMIWYALIKGESYYGTSGIIYGVILTLSLILLPKVVTALGP